MSHGSTEAAAAETTEAAAAEATEAAAAKMAAAVTAAVTAGSLVQLGDGQVDDGIPLRGHGKRFQVDTANCIVI